LELELKELEEQLEQGKEQGKEQELGKGKRHESQEQ